MTKQILIVDDDALMRRSLAYGLEQAGYRTSSAGNAEDALLLSRQALPDLVLLDIGLPGIDGLDALRHFKDRLGVPVIFLTARRRESDEILGLELGADDYLIKPVNLDRLLAHVKAVLRRTEIPASIEIETSPIQVGDLIIDTSSHTVTVGDHPVELRPREFALLRMLALQPNRVFSTDELLASIWGAEFAGEPQVVYVHIRWLRQKIELDADHPRRIITVHGIGYKLIPNEG